MARTLLGETASSDDPPPRSRSALESVSKFGLVALDAAAASLSVAATRLSSPLPIKVTATLSGSLWTGTAIYREYDNSPRRMMISSVNVLSGAVGALATTAPHLAGENRKAVRYASAAGWAVNGAANLVRAIGTSDATIANRVLTGASGLANAAGAALSAASVNAAAENKSDDAVKLATASGAMLLAGWAADAAAAWADRNRSKLLDSEHHGLHHLRAHHERGDETDHAVADRPENSAHSHHSPHPGSSLPEGRANAPAEAPPRGLRHLHAHHQRGDETDHAVADRPENSAHSHHSPHPGSSLPEGRANAPAEAPPHGLHHLHRHYEQDGVDGHPVVTEVNAPDHQSVPYQGFGGENATGAASTTENARKPTYDQRQRTHDDGLDL
jgi:hypothetical protein